MDSIVFGTGEAGKRILPFLEKKYHILFMVDNDEKKWGTMFESYRVESPDEIKKHACAVIISSPKYDMEISEQLESMGVRRDRIYTCHDLQEEGQEFTIHSMERPLVQYDLCNEEERRTGKRKVMIFCRGYSVYSKQLIENLSKRYDDIEFSLLTKIKKNKEKILAGQLRHIYYFQTMLDLKMILEKLPVYDAMHLLWMEKEWACLYQLIRTKAYLLNLNVGGSDFYRAGTEEKNSKKNLIDCADRIMAQTETTARNFVEYYGDGVKNKTYILPYGIEVLEWIDRNTIPGDIIKKKYKIPLDKVVVTCGHNANEAHQHMKIIDAIERLPESIRKQMICVFPMTYPQGNDDYIAVLRERLERSDVNYMILTEFMNFQEMAEYARISDIMIHVQITDQLSSAMLEEMYAGSIIAAGKWLPYRSLHKMGLFFFDVEEVSDLTVLLEEIILNMEKYKKKCINNRELVWRHSSWENLASKWYALWTEKKISGIASVEDMLNEVWEK